MDDRPSSKNGAKELLLSIVSEEEWNRFNQTGTLEIAARGGIYRISMHAPTSVLDSETRRAVATVRSHLTTSESARDRVIAEYLLIRHDENLYWQTVTISPETSGFRVYRSLLVAAFDAMLLLILLIELR